MPPITAWFRVGVPTSMIVVQASSTPCSFPDWTCLTVNSNATVPTPADGEATVKVSCCLSRDCASLPRCKCVPSRNVWWTRPATTPAPILVVTKMVPAQNTNTTATVFLPLPLFTSSLRCACLVHSLSLLAQVVQSVESTLGKKGVVTSCLCLVFDFPTVVAEHGSGTESGGVTVT